MVEDKKNSQTRSASVWHRIVRLVDRVKNKRTNERTDAGNRIWGIVALNCDIWWQ